MNPMLIIIFVLLAGLLITLVLAYEKSKARPVSLAARLQQTGGTSAGISLRDAEEMDKSLFARLVLPLTNKLSKPFSSITPAKLISQCDQAITEAGMTGKISASQLTTISFLGMVGLPIFMAIMLYPQVQTERISMNMYYFGCFLSVILGYRLPIGMVQSKAKARKNDILRALPFTFDLISISVSAGMALDGAMTVVSERTKGPLADELSRTLREINLGIPRSEALLNLCKRTGVEDLKNFVVAINYISKLGGSLSEVIKVQTEAMRVKRRQRAETKANQAPVKMMIPLVLFILPCLFLVILGPAAVQFASGGLFGKG